MNYLILEERVQGVKEDNYIRENTQKLVEGRISTIDYQKILRDNGINPQIEEVYRKRNRLINT